VAGTLIIDTIEDGSGNSMPTSTAIKGTAKTWVSFWGQTQYIRNSLNVSSITRASAGAYRVNFTTAFPDVNFAVVATSNDNGSGNGCLALLTETYPSNVSFLTINPANLSQTDASFVSVVFFK
jgi:hypothetical protein